MSTDTISLLGRSGCGKDTQAALLEQKFGYAILSTGVLFRALAQEPTAAGKRVAALLEKGDLPPGWLAEFLWTRWLLEKKSLPEHLIFNGAPRRLDEAKELDEVLDFFERVDLGVLLIDISRAEAKRRLLKRGRADDDERAINERLDWFEKDVLPVIDYYERSSRLVRINGQQPIEDVFKEILSKLDA